MKLASEVQVFKRDESKMRNAPAWFILVSGLMWVILIIGLIFMFMRHFLLGGVILAGVGVFYIYSETQFNYYEQVEYEFKKDSVVYSYRLNSDIMGGNNKAKFILRDIISVKPRGKYVIVQGNIEKKLPLRRVKKLKKVRLLANFGTSTGELFNALNSCIKEV